MIQKIQSDSIDIIDPLVITMREKIGKDVVPYNIGDTLKKSVTEGKNFLYGVFDEDDYLQGFGFWKGVSEGISYVFSEDPELETLLIDEIFRIHSIDCSTIMAAGPWVTESISKHLIKIGFRELERAYMSVYRDANASLDYVNLPKNMNFENYDEKYRIEVASVIFKGNNGLIDQIVFPNFLGSVEKCVSLVKDIENSVYGTYMKPYSWILKHDEKIIGACFMTIHNDEGTGYIPDIVIDPDYQGQRLGKAILVHSLKNLLEGESNIEKVSLDVTLENNARYLYQSLGFTTVNEYSMYTWVK